MIYIGQYKGKQVYHEEPFVATDSHIDKNYSCPKCGAKMGAVDDEKQLREVQMECKRLWREDRR